MSSDKVRENRLRRMAERQGLRLEKSRRRDPLATDYGTWAIVDPNSGALLYGGGEATTGGVIDLDDVERWLREPDSRGDKA